MMGEDRGVRERKLLDEINQYRLLRDAQDPTGPMHVHFQREIEALTATLMELRRVTPEAERLEEQLRRVHSEWEGLAAAASSSQDPWAPPAVFCGLLGAAVLLVSLWRGFGVAAVVIGVALLLLGLAAMAASTVYRREAADKAEAARAAVDEVTAELAALTVEHPARPERPVERPERPAADVDVSETRPL